VKLSEFKQGGRGAHSRFVTEVTDTATQEEHELAIAGPGALVKRMFEKADLDLKVDSGRSASDVQSDFRSDSDEHAKAMWELAGLEDTAALLKPPPPDQKEAVFVSARGKQGPGTPFALVASSFFVPAGASLFFFGSFVFTAIASLRPTSGDQDLYLHLFSGTGPVVAASFLGGTSLDLVWFTSPLFPLVPVFEVKGFTTGVCGVFAAQGA